MDIELQPLTVLTSIENYMPKICTYIEETENVDGITDFYYLQCIDDDYNIKLLVGGFKKPYPAAGIKAIRDLLDGIKYEGDNFRRVYVEIAMVTHILAVINKTHRGKNKPVGKLVGQAIELYREIHPQNYEIYWTHHRSNKNLAFVGRVACALVLYSVISLIILVLLYAWLYAKF